ncbi:Iron/ascorbate family oxidoreductase [Handroanthus impetiginosus]|uniref:Iron/ascorbate family oxidoreductase n=1 Tax=Handroanthus impetiginosus TaxID=429701 RepID=A0A2G9GFI2_9LAMI|nr:Iron/ascorbate family oxidoreductase [Handroanthus impetiginosus]
MEVQSIQEMVKSSINEIPTRYLVDQESVDKSSPPAAIPVLDMKSLISEEGKTSQLEKLHSVCKDWGIFQLVNHGVDFSVVEKLKYEIQEFYKLPLEEKLRYKLRPGDVEGYGQTIILSPDQKFDWADRFYILTNPIHRRKPHLLPELPSSFREILEAYTSELQKLARTIFELIAKALKIERIEVEEIFENGMQSVRMTYYPPCPQPNKVIGLTPHSDVSGITILLQVNGVGGFQVKKDGIWMPVEILPDAFVVNLGDIIEILSNGSYKSIEHRATVNSEKERITISMFFNPKFEAQVGPSHSIIANQPPLFRCMKMEQYFKDFLSRKFNGKSFLDYMKVQN